MSRSFHIGYNEGFAILFKMVYNDKAVNLQTRSDIYEKKKYSDFFFNFHNSSLSDFFYEYPLCTCLRLQCC
jgi:hypothetical protein